MKLYIKRSQYGYSHRIKNDYQGKESSMYLDVQFVQGSEPTANALQIDVTDAFFSCYDSSTGVKPKLVVKEYDIIKIFDDEPTTSEEPVEETNEETNDDDSQFEFPFDYD